MAVVAGGIALSSVGPPPAGAPSLGPFGAFGTDKWLHFGAYLALAGALAYAFVERGTREADPGALATVLLLAVGYGLAIEAVQFGLPARRFDPADGLANAAGATVAVGLWTPLARWVRFRRVSPSEDDC